MTILNIGSVNIDHVYRVTRLPKPGETIADRAYAVHLGGKGANMSLAAALAGADVHHVGAVGAEGAWCRDRLAAAGVNTDDLATVDAATGHAVITVDDAGENVIVIHAGANRTLAETQIEAAMTRCSAGDWLLLQNETNLVEHAARTARAIGLKVAYAAAPFDAEAARTVLPHVDLLSVNAIEAGQLADHLGTPAADLPVQRILITLGAGGALYRDGDSEHRAEAFRVTPIDTTGAGDTFLGYFLAGLDLDQTPEHALRRAAAAAAVQITRPGAADAIPAGAEVDSFLAGQA